MSMKNSSDAVGNRNRDLSASRPGRLISVSLMLFRPLTWRYLELNCNLAQRRTFVMLRLICQHHFRDVLHVRETKWQMEFLRNKRPGSRSQWPRRLRRGSAVTRLLGLWVRIPPKSLMSTVVSVVCCKTEVSESGWSLVKRSPTECGVSECDEGTSQRRPRPVHKWVNK